MLKFGTLCCAVFALTIAQAHAVNVNGTWKGAGKISDNQGHVTACETVILTIVHTPTVLNVSSDFTCAGTRTNAPGGNLELRGGDVYDHGTKIGAMTDTSITLSEKDAQHTLDTHTTFTNSDMTFRTVTTNAATPGHVFTFDGVVHRQ